MRDRTILHMRRRIARVLVPVDAWSLAPRGRFQGLQRFAWRFLERMGALKRYDREDEVEHRQAIDGADLMDRILRAKRAAFDECLGLPRHILIGDDEFCELLANPRMQGEFVRFDVQYPGGVDGKPAMLGLTWHVLPWMRGFLVLPEGW